MGYIDSNLLPDEKIVYRVRLHGMIFWKPCALILLGIVFLFLQPIGRPPMDGVADDGKAALAPRRDFV